MHDHLEGVKARLGDRNRDTPRGTSLAVETQSTAPKGTEPAEGRKEKGIGVEVDGEGFEGGHIGEEGEDLGLVLRDGLATEGAELGDVVGLPCEVDEVRDDGNEDGRYFWEEGGEGKA